MKVARLMKMMTHSGNNSSSRSRTTSRKMVVSAGALLVTILLSTPSADAAQGEPKGSMSHTTAVEGDVANIPCQAPPSTRKAPVLLTLWYKDGIPTPIYSYDARQSEPQSWVDDQVLGMRAHFITDEETSYLQLFEVKAKDAGVYVCRVDYKRAPTQRARARLSVIVPPGQPAILQANGTRVQGRIGPFEEGSTATIICQVVGGHPPPTVKWWHTANLMDQEIDSSEDSVYNNVLQVGPLTRDHFNATYVCQAENSDLVGPISTDVTLEIYYKPLSVELLGSGQPLTSNTAHDITCQSTGALPPAVITWWLGDQQMSNDSIRTDYQGNVTLSTLTLVPDSFDGGKSLRCSARSPVIDHEPIKDEWVLDVQYKPTAELEVADDVDLTDIREGDNVTLVCDVVANPTVTKVTWFHKGMQVVSNESAGVLVKPRKLKLIYIQRHQSGHYTCIASNTIGDGRSSAVVLDVKYVPVCSDDTVRELGAAKQDKVEMDCRVNASPDQVTFQWFLRKPDALVPVPSEKFTVQDQTSRLTYHVEDESDYGELLCYASNEVGEQSVPCAFEIVEAGKPEAFENCTLTNQTTDTLFVACIPGYDGGLEQEFVVEVFEFDGKSRHKLFNMTETAEPTFTIEELQPGTSYLLAMYAENTKGKSEQRVLHGFTLPSKPKASAPMSPTYIFPITPILGVLIGVVGALVLVAIVVVVVMKLRGDSRRAKERHDPPGLKVPHSPLQHSKDGDDGPDVILCRTDPAYEDVDGIPQKLKHANIYETVPYDNKDKNTKNSENCDKDDVEYAELTFNNGKNKNKSHKKLGGGGANGTVRSAEDATIYATIDHARTAQQQQEQQQLKPQKPQPLQGNKAGKQAGGDLDSAAQREPDEIPLMDAALESSV